MADPPRSRNVEWIRSPAAETPPSEDPRKARFRWKEGDAILQTEDFDQEELEAQIAELERRGEEVPSAFREALDGFRSGG